MIENAEFLLILLVKVNRWLQTKSLANKSIDKIGLQLASCWYSCQQISVGMCLRGLLLRRQGRC